MPQVTLLLIGLSCVLHASWNVLARGGSSSTIFMGRMLVVIAVLGLVPATASELLTGSMPLTAWVCVVGSGICCGFYSFFLATGYDSADLSVVYPIVRGLPVLLVGLGDAFRGQPPSPTGWAGMTLVLTGCFIVPLTSLHSITLRHYLNYTSAWVVLAALGTVGYSLLDKVAAEAVLPGPASAARYAYFFFLFACLAYWLFTRLFGRPENGHSVGWKAPLVAGTLSFAAYWLVLWAYQVATRASYVLAFRQFSVVLGVMMALALYGEKGRVVRILGALCVTAGLIVIGVWGG